VVGVFVVVILVGGCGVPSSQSGSSSAPLPAGVSRDQVVPADGIAKDARGLQPCELITTDQARELGIEIATAEQSAPDVIPGCRWNATDRSFGVGVKVDTAKGLANLYRSHAGTPFRQFEPMRVDGYPAARADVVEDGLDCTIYVGLAENQTMWVMGTDRAGGDSCAITRPVLSAILANLPPLR
jgi:hypothetical protein